MYGTSQIELTNFVRNGNVIILFVIKRDLFVAQSNCCSGFTVLQQEELMKWHLRGVKEFELSG